MVGKITAVLAKREAEAYSSQGLHREAINLYTGLLSESPNIDPAIKTAIQSQVQGLSKELQTSDASREGPLSSQEIRRIRQGWGARATETDILVCAQAFCQVGSYADALKEFRHLLQTAGLKKNYVQGAADCLARLHSPEAMAVAVVCFAKEVCPTPRAALAVQLAMAKHLAAGRQIAYAAAIFQDLKNYPALAPMADQYLSKYAAAKKRVPTAPTPGAEAPPKGRFSLKRMVRFFRKRENHRIDPDGQGGSCTGA